MTPYLQDADVTLYHGDVLDVLAQMPDATVDCVVCSPPYWGLRSYLADGHEDKPLELGLEPTPDQYVTQMVAVFREVRRVLAPHGTCWVNLGDSYAGSGPSGASYQSETTKAREGKSIDGSFRLSKTLAERGLTYADKKPVPPPGLKSKDLVGIPWRVAFALQQDGWWLRSDIVWAKPNPMPESVTDRPTKAHEYVFLLTKQPRYFFDQEAVREPHKWEHVGAYRLGERSKNGGSVDAPVQGHGNTTGSFRAFAEGGRNVRSVWTIATQPYAAAHFATYPEELVRRCVLAGCPERVCRTCGKASERIVEKELVDVWHRNKRPTKAAFDTEAQAAGDQASRRARDGHVSGHAIHATTLGWSDCGHNDWRPGVILDPFAGSGTTCKVARDHGRHSIGIDLSADYLELAAKRLQQQSLFSEPAA